MLSNLEKYKKDLSALIEKGERLLDSIQKEYKSESNEADQNTADAKDLPSFRDEYQSWYSESLAAIKQLIPERKNDFIKHYEQPKNRGPINSENYKIEDYLLGLKTNLTAPRNRMSNWDRMSNLDWEPPPDYLRIVIFQFRQQLALLRSAERQLESSLFDIRKLVQADLFDNELDAAAELNKKGFVRGAGAMAGVVLEGHLKEVCNNKKIKITKKRPTINDLNQLLKDNEVIDMPAWRNIQRLADLRNLCDHKNKSDPTKAQVNEFIEGVEKIIKTLF